MNLSEQDQSKFEDWLQSMSPSEILSSLKGSVMSRLQSDFIDTKEFDKAFESWADSCKIDDFQPNDFQSTPWND